MKKCSTSKNGIVGAVFLCIIMVIFIFSFVCNWKNIGSGILQTGESINREDSISDIAKTIISQFEMSFSSNIIWKEEMANVGSNLFYLFTGDIDSIQVSLGKDNWLFYKSVTDGNLELDYSGESSYSDETMREIAANLDEMNRYFAEKGVEFLVLIPPNKSQIYSDKVTEWERISDFSRTDRLVEYLKDNTEVTVLHPKEEIRRYADSYDLYYKYDSHWNTLGAYIAYENLLENLGYEIENLEELQIENKDLPNYDVVADDLARMLGMRWKFSDEQIYSVEGYRYPLEADDEKIVHQKNENSVYQEKVMMIGDSYGASIVPYFSEDFKEFYFCHRNSYTKELMEEFTPDIVILEYVERYSGRMGKFKLNLK